MTERSIHAGDNLEFLGGLSADSVQMVYMDPPFASGREFKAVLQARRSGGSEMVDAFSDSWDKEASGTQIAGNVRPLLDALRTIVSPAMSNYLTMMTARLQETWRVLDPTGSMYLHVDPTASHYLKMVADAIFKPENFRSEIIWRRTHAHSSSKRYGPVHDVILFYTKTSRFTWNQPYTPYTDGYLEKYYTKVDASGRFQLITCTGPGDRTGSGAHYEWNGVYPPPGRHWAWKKETMEALDRSGLLVHSANGIPRRKKYVHEAPGVPLQDVWSDVARLDANSRERTGYETQKPVSLLERMIDASTNRGDLVIDPFSGSGTTAVAAENRGRNWMVSDKSLLAASLTLSRTRNAAGNVSISLKGFPSTVVEANALRAKSPTTYGAWGTSMLGAAIDRIQSSAAVTAGNGQLIEGRSRSWVPVADAPVNEIDTPQPSEKIAVGLTLGAPSAAQMLRRKAENTRLDLRVLNVRLQDVVSRSARTAGIATSLTTGSVTR